MCNAVEQFSIVTDLSSTILSLQESWRRNVVIYNERRGKVEQLPLVEVFPYLIEESL